MPHRTFTNAKFACKTYRRGCDILSHRQFSLNLQINHVASRWSRARVLFLDHVCHESSWLLFPAGNFTSSRRGRDDRRRRLRLRLFFAPQSGYVVLEVADGWIPSRLGRHLTSNAAVDRALPPFSQTGQVAGVRGGLSRPWQRFRDVRQGFPAGELVAAVLSGRPATAPFAQYVGQLSKAWSPTALVRRRGVLGLVRRRDRRNLRRGVSSACSWGEQTRSCYNAGEIVIVIKSETTSSCYRLFTE